MKRTIIPLLISLIVLPVLSQNKEIKLWYDKAVSFGVDALLRNIKRRKLHF